MPFFAAKSKNISAKVATKCWRFCWTVCVQKKIGWRKQSRKLVVMSTDAIFHYAGDGKVSVNDKGKLLWKDESQKKLCMVMIIVMVKYIGLLGYILVLLPHKELRCTYYNVRWSAWRECHLWEAFISPSNGSIYTTKLNYFYESKTLMCDICCISGLNGSVVSSD